ncbi:MAG: hypothetical protein WCI88_12745 [Chloroflexota bacterium]
MKNIFLLFGCIALTAACQSASATPQIAQTVPPPATVTMTPPATPTSTLVPTPVPLFFTDEFRTDLRSWVSFQTGGTESPTVKLENDFLRLDFPLSNTWYYAIHTVHEYSGVFVSAKFSGTPTGSLGVICNYSETKGWYEFNIASDGTYGILFGQWLAQGIAQYTPIAVSASEYLQAGNLTYEIGLTCQDNLLLLHINGKLIRKIDVTRYGLTEGKIGITASSFEEVPMIATFDWVKVGEPE